jgi:hypothetical protein
LYMTEGEQWYHRGIKYARLLFGSHEGFPIIRIGKPAPAIMLVLVN